MIDIMRLWQFLFNSWTVAVQNLE